MKAEKFNNDVLPMAEKYITIPETVPEIVEYLRKISNHEYTFARLVDEETRLVAEMNVKLDDLLSEVQGSSYRGIRESTRSTRVSS